LADCWTKLRARCFDFWTNGVRVQLAVAGDVSWVLHTSNAVVTCRHDRHACIPLCSLGSEGVKRCEIARINSVDRSDFNA